MSDKDIIREYAQASEALCRWFESQDIPVSKACGLMCFLIGITLAEGSPNFDELVMGITKHERVMQAAAFAAFRARD